MAASTRLSLVHLTQPPRIPSPHQPPLLLLLHGVGSHEGDLMGLAPYLDGRFFIVSARGPVTLAPGMFAWFHVQLDPAQPIINAEEAERSRLALVRFIDEATAAYGTDPARTYLLGFSQGAIMSVSLALTHPEKLAGVAAMSGRVLPEVLPKMAPAERMRGLPILVVHGTEDPILPIHHGRAIRDRLSALPVTLTYREYTMGHYVSDESLADVATWLQQRLDEPPRQRLADRRPGTNQEDTTT
jgi:phospholipase/carboxylesterase